MPFCFCSDTFDAEGAEIRVTKQDPRTWEGETEIPDGKVVTAPITTLVFSQPPLQDVEVELQYVAQPSTPARRLLQDAAAPARRSEVFLETRSAGWERIPSKDTGRRSLSVMVGAKEAERGGGAVTMLVAEDSGTAGGPVVDDPAGMDMAVIIGIAAGGGVLVIVLVVVIVVCCCCRGGGRKGRAAARPEPQGSGAVTGAAAQAMSRGDMIFMNVRLPRRRSKGPARDAIP